MTATNFNIGISKLQAELNFFESLVAASTSGWDVNISPGFEIGSGNLSSLSTRIYLVDTHSGWACASSAKPEIFKGANDLVRAGKINIEDATKNLGSAVLELGAQGKPASEQEEGLLEAATMACAVYLLGTSTFEQAMAFGGEGHWIVLTYKMRDNSHVLRPVFFRDDSLSYLPFEHLRRIVRQVTQLDASNAQTNVGRMLAKCGGAVFASQQFAP